MGSDKIVINGLRQGTSIGAVYIILCSDRALPHALLADMPIKLFPSSRVSVTDTLPVAASYVNGTVEPL